MLTVCLLVKGHCSNTVPAPAPSPTTIPATDDGHCPASSTNADTLNTANELDTQDTLAGSSVSSDPAILDNVNTEPPFRSLPSFEPSLSMTYLWVDVLGEEFIKVIGEAYA